VLAVVEDEHAGRGGQLCGARGQHVALDHAQPECLRQGVRDRAGFRHRRQEQHPDRIHASGELERDPRLADPARSHDRDQPLAVEQPLQRRHMGVPADEGGDRLGWRTGAGARPLDDNGRSGGGGVGCRRRRGDLSIGDRLLERGQLR
jgi:hypothetical protein